METSVRSIAYTSREVWILLQLVAKYKNTVESKETGASAWISKKHCWESQITPEFNAQSCGTPRSAESLLNKYRHLSSVANKEFARFREDIKLKKMGEVVTNLKPISEASVMIKDIRNLGGLEGLDYEFESLVSPPEHLDRSECNLQIETEHKYQILDINQSKLESAIINGTLNSSVTLLRALKSSSATPGLRKRQRGRSQGAAGSHLHAYVLRKARNEVELSEVLLNNARAEEERRKTAFEREEKYLEEKRKIELAVLRRKLNSYL